MSDYTYRPPGPVSRAFMLSDKFVRGIKGPIGSGKSTACVMDVLRRCKMQKPSEDGKRRSRWAIIRNTYPELKTTTIKTWHQWVPPDIGKWQSEGPPTHFINEGDLMAEIMFIALDRPKDVRKLLSLELTGAWMNEAREIPKAVLDGLTGRVGRYPSAKDGGCSWRGIIMDTNPPDDDHWWYTMAEEDTPEDFEFFSQPGGRDENAENRENLPSDYYEKAVQGKGADWIAVYVDGKYGYIQDGKPVYPDYNDNLHCQEFDVPEKATIHIGIDFGLTPAAAFGFKDVMGRWLVFDELVAQDMGAKNFGRELRRFIKQHYPHNPIGSITGDPAGDSRAQTDETTPFQILKTEEIHAKPAHTNDFVKRVEAVNMSHNRLIDGIPGYRIHPRCKKLRKAKAGRYQYRRVQMAGDERYIDKPDKNEYSHVAEAEQYLFLGAGEGKELVKSQPKAPRRQHAVTSYNMFGD